jgi:HAD superfamily hydrolase (TIGR01490 family)
MNDDKKKYFAFFDLDRTIINTNSGNILVLKAYRKHLLNTRGLLKAITQGYKYRLHIRDTHLIIEEMGRWLKGKDTEALENLCREVSQKLIDRNMRKEVLREIDYHRNNGGIIIILSSAIEQICKHFGERIKADGMICSRMESINGILTGKPDGKFCFDEEKKIRLVKYCEEHNSNPSSAWYYADSIADLQALEAVGNPVCVHPDRRLRKNAVSKGWRILE